MVTIKISGSFFLNVLILFASFLLVMPVVFANDIGEGIGIDFETEDFDTLLWMCDNRKVIDDDLEAGRVEGDPVYAEKIETCELTWEQCVTQCIQEAESVCHSENRGPSECEIDQDSLGCVTLCYDQTLKVTGDPDTDDLLNDLRTDLSILLGRRLTPSEFNEIRRMLRSLDPCRILKGHELKERIENYIFEGEKIEWIVLAMDKNKIEEVKDVVVAIGDPNGGGGGTVVLEESVEFCDTISTTTTDWNDMLTLEKFDTSLGTLTKAELSLNSEMTSSVSIEHTSDISGADITAHVEGTVSVVLLNGSVLMMNLAFVDKLFMSSVFDGDIDFGGTSGITFPTDMASDSIDVEIVDLALVSTGTPIETFDLDVSAVGVSQVTGSGNIVSNIVTNAEATGCIEYTYEVERTIPSKDPDIEVECVRLNGFAAPGERLDPSCNARIGEEELTQFDDQTMAYYECTFTAEGPESMYGEEFVNVMAIDLNDDVFFADETELWFFNPIIALRVDGDVRFGDGVQGVRPGTISYSDTILVENDADIGSGVLLDMFISGTDFYDPDSVGSRCVITNRLKLGNNFAASRANHGNDVCRIGFGDTDDHLCYFASNGAYSTLADPRSDAEGYAPIVYGDNFDTDFYNDAEVIWEGFGGALGPYSPGNVLSPGAEIAVTFKLGLPEPCVGDFTDGEIFFWGEAI